ncbi:ribonuclease D [uncultured Pseudoteredinibacter sp.]|uniref:ribonuclease D n=1 Tax=uncultured Pseudoteredinibacter sp. TaxID=1641701 RepID=UPI0026152CBB|nr:ribonuclease D [uncultured Pseudoteredinibacter sp.]
MSEGQKLQWIDSAEALRELCQQCLGCEAIAVDTEFMRSSTFFPKIGLLQINNGSANYLIDPLKLASDDLEPLRELWQSTSVVKIVHACSEDLEVFQHWLGVSPTPLFDTQIAASYAGVGFSMSYAKLVLHFLGLELEKGETRSDWLKRPLSESQCHYAALDVEYLLQVYSHLIETLNKLTRLEYVQEDCARLVANSNTELDASLAYLKVKSAWRLSPRSLAVLQSLCIWREEQARLRDVPRSRLLKDAQLFALAKRPPKNMKELARVEGIPARTLREDGQYLLNASHRAVDEQEAWPDVLEKPLSVEQGQQLKALRDHGHEMAAEQNLATELLFNKKEWEELLRHFLFATPLQSARFQGWRAEQFLPALRDYFKQSIEA